MSSKQQGEKLPSALYYYDYYNKLRLQRGIIKPRIFENYSNKDFTQYLQYLVKDDFKDKHFK